MATKIGYHLLITPSNWEYLALTSSPKEGPAKRAERRCSERQDASDDEMGAQSPQMRRARRTSQGAGLGWVMASPITRTSTLKFWNQDLEERVGFEPTSPAKGLRFSRPPRSTAPPSLLSARDRERPGSLSDEGYWPFRLTRPYGRGTAFPDRPTLRLHSCVGAAQGTYEALHRSACPQLRR